MTKKPTPIVITCACLLRPEIILVCGLVKFVPAVAYQTCLKLPETFMQPHTSLISMPDDYFAWKYWSSNTHACVFDALPKPLQCLLISR